MTKKGNPARSLAIQLYHFINCIIISTAIIAFVGCKKTAIDNSLPLHEVGFVQKFFALKGTESPAVLQTVQKLKANNELTGFVNKLPANCGLPIWSKIVIHQRNNASQENHMQIPERVIIPLQLKDSCLSSIIIAYPQADSSYYIKCLTANNYLYNECHSAALNVNKATNDLLLFFYMENRAFGTTHFYNIPAPFFPQNNNLDKDGTKTIIVKPRQSTGTNLVADPDPGDGGDDCIWVVCSLNPTGICLYCLNGAGDDGGGYDDPPGGGGGSGGSGGGGGPWNPGGGGNGGGGDGGTPCGNNFSWYSINFVSGGNGCPPPPPPPTYANPCDFIAKLQSDPNFIAKFYELNQNSLFRKTYETGYQVNSRTSNNYLKVQGQSGAPTIEWNVPPGTKVDGFLHCHCDGLNNVFSPQDIIYMAQMFLQGYAADTANLYMGVTSSIDQPYLVKINNIAKFRSFAVSIAGESGNDSTKMNNFIDEYKSKLNSRNSSSYVQDNETAFLKLINDKLGSDGLTLFIGNDQCSEWTKLKLGSDGKTITKVDCPANL